MTTSWYVLHARRQTVGALCPAGCPYTHESGQVILRPGDLVHEKVPMHECPHCHYRFDDQVALDRHLNEGEGCPEA